MTLASMIELDEGALICDLAETYHIYDYRSLPLRTVATLSAGLRDDSRIKLKASGLPVSQDTLLRAIIADRIEAIRYMFSDDDSRRRYPAVMLADALLGEPNRNNDPDIISFESSYAFEAALTKIRGE